MQDGATPPASPADTSTWPTRLTSACLLVVVGWLALCASSLLLTRLAMFDGLAALLLTAAAMWAARHRVRRWASERPVVSVPVFVTAAIVAILGGWFAAAYTTAEFLFLRDPGVYTLLTHYVVDNETTAMNVPALAWGREALGEAIGGEYAALHPLHQIDPSAGEGVLMARFNHLTVSLRAVFVDLGGRAGFAWSNAAIAGVGLGMAVLAGARVAEAATAVWLVEREGRGDPTPGPLQGPWWCAGWGAAAAIWLTLNTSFVYVSRSTMTEVVTLGLVLATFWAASLLDESLHDDDLRADHLPLGLTVGAAGLVMFSRVDGYLILTFLLALLAGRVLRRPETWRSGVVAVGVGALLAALSVLDLWLFSRNYLVMLWTRRGVMGPLMAGSAAVVVATVVAQCGVGLSARSEQGRALWERARDRVGWIFPAFVVLAALAFAVLCWRAAHIDLGPARVAQGYDMVYAFEDRAAFEMTWYVPLPMLGVAGLAAVGLARPRMPSWLPALATFVLFAVVMAAYKTHIFPDHPWASRRWLGVVIPGVLLLVSGAASLPRPTWARVGSAVAVAGVSALYLAGQLHMNSQWLFMARQSEWPAHFDALANKARGQEAVILVSRNREIAAPLTFMYGIPTLYIVGHPLHPAYSMRGVKTERFCVDGLKRVWGHEHYEFAPPTIGVGPRCMHPNLSRLIRRSDPRAPQWLPFNQKSPWGPLLLEGFAPREDWGVWTQAQRAEFYIPTGGGFQGRALDLTLEARSFVHTKHPTQSVGIKIGGKDFGRWVFHDGRPLFERKTFRVPAQHTRGKGRLTVELDLPDAMSPASLGAGPDNRPLGLGISGVELRVVDAGNAGPPVPQKSTP